MDSNDNVTNNFKKVERAYAEDTKKKLNWCEPFPKPQAPKQV